MSEFTRDLSRVGGAVSAGLSQLSFGLQRQASREMERVRAQALLAVEREQGRALLTNTALQNTAALSALEAHCLQVAPLGDARYKLIVDAYAMGAANTIARWT